MTGQQEIIENDNWEIYVANWMSDEDRAEVEDLMMYLLQQLSPEKLGRVVNGSCLCYALANVAVGMITKASERDEGLTAHVMLTIDGLQRLVTEVADTVRDRIPKETLTLLTETEGSA